VQRFGDYTAREVGWVAVEVAAMGITKDVLERRGDIGNGAIGEEVGLLGGNEEREGRDGEEEGGKRAHDGWRYGASEDAEERCCRCCRGSCRWLESGPNR